MSTDDREDGRAVMLAGWQKAVDDREALLRDPEAHTTALTEQAQQAFAQGVITDEDLRELRLSVGPNSLPKASGGAPFASAMQLHDPAPSSEYSSPHLGR